MIETIAVGVIGGLAGVTISELTRWFKLSHIVDEVSEADKKEREELRNKLACSYFKSGENRTKVEAAFDKLSNAKNYLVQTQSKSSYAGNKVYQEADVDKAKELVIAAMLILSELKERI